MYHDVNNTAALFIYIYICMYVCVCVCVCVCARACVRACVCVCSLTSRCACTQIIIYGVLARCALMVIMVQLQQIISPILPALTKTYRYSYGMDDRCFRADLRPLIWAASYDPEAQDFMRESYERRLRWSAWIADSALCGWLTLFFSRTTVNALLNRGHMHVLSTAQLQVLIGSALSMNDSGPSGGGDGIGSSLGVASAQARLCDIGAGEGGVTARFEPLLRNTGCITVTETDPVMRMRLARRGYSVQTPQEWAAATEERYEVISCLNVLDRCDTPLTLLKDMRLRLAPDGLLLIALLPHDGSTYKFPFFVKILYYICVCVCVCVCKPCSQYSG